MKETVLKKHIREIKVRMVYTIMSMVLTFMTAWIYSSELIHAIAEPLEKAHDPKGTAQGFHFIFTELTEAF